MARPKQDRTVPKREALDDRYFARREDILAAFADLPPIDYRRFREDVDAILDQDPTPPAWRD
jgi:hypothetical protein